MPVLPATSLLGADPDPVPPAAEDSPVAAGAPALLLDVVVVSLPPHAVSTKLAPATTAIDFNQTDLGV
jgi:hypothetical protein